MTPSHLLNQFLDRLGTLLLIFGLGLLGIGVLVHASRYVRMRQVRAARPAPRFEESLRAEAPDVQGGRLVAPVITDEPELREGRMPVRIVIPSIDVDSEIAGVGWEARIVNGQKQGNVWETADYAAGFHENSAAPGSVGNTVISGHNNRRGSVFRDIYELAPGDEIYLEDGSGVSYGYEVAESFVVREEGASAAERRDNTHWIRQTPDERLTLVSCFPPWSHSHRAIVVAFPATNGEPPGATDGAPQ